MLEISDSELIAIMKKAIVAMQEAREGSLPLTSEENKYCNDGEHSYNFCYNSPWGDAYRCTKCKSIRYYDYY